MFTFFIFEHHLVQCFFVGSPLPPYIHLISCYIIPHCLQRCLRGFLCINIFNCWPVKHIWNVQYNRSIVAKNKTNDLAKQTHLLQSCDTKGKIIWTVMFGLLYVCVCYHWVPFTCLYYSQTFSRMCANQLAPVSAWHASCPPCDKSAWMSALVAK